MSVLAWIVGVLLIVMIGGAGVAKLMNHPMTVESRDHLGVSPGLDRIVGILEVLGGLGVLFGLFVDGNLEWFGALAAIGIIALMIGAVVYHQRAGDGPKEMAPALVALVLAIVYLLTFGQVGS